LVREGNAIMAFWAKLWALLAALISVFGDVAQFWKKVSWYSSLIIWDIFFSHFWVVVYPLMMLLLLAYYDM
jgi:hypothetical protein